MPRRACEVFAPLPFPFVSSPVETPVGCARLYGISTMLDANGFGVIVLLSAALTASPITAKDRKPVETFTPSAPMAAATMPTSGAIFVAEHYSPLTSGSRAARVGDILTIVLTERMSATKSNSATTGRDGSMGITPPATGVLNLFDPSDIKMGGGQSFKGKGDAAQSNALSGEVSVTVAAVYPNGTMLVRGEKLMTLNRGDEAVQFSGLVRIADISTDNRVLSTRVADARIRYTGKGEIARASKQGWLQSFFSKISPF